MPTKPLDPSVRLKRSLKICVSGCWEWQLSKDRTGYGRLKIQMGSRDVFRFSSAHRYAYEVWVGAIPPSMNVLHRCDNRSCCNPDHLFLGTQSDNMRDMYAKDRGPKNYRRDPEVCRLNAMRRKSIAAPARDAAIDAARKGTP